MNIIRKVSVLPHLPERIARLRDLAYNLWWSWEPDAQKLYADIDLGLWNATNHNPVKFLQRVHQSSLNRVAADSGYLAAYDKVMQSFDAYMSPDAITWFKSEHADWRNRVIAYFSAEFGLHEALPIYSGGLGVLSGDHCKAASDLDLPFIGIGFLYPQGYFTQHLDHEGRQHAEYEKIDFSEVPALPALNSQGQEVLINVDLPGRTVYAKIWKIQIGRIPIFLMDTDVERNAPPDRELSARLYGGDREMRISQEVVLGIGGVRAVRALGYDPAVWHMNEGHSAFLGLERVRELVQGQGLSFAEATEVVRANSLFTTHTPVPAGNDSFAFELVEKFFWQYWGQLGIDRERFLQFARQELTWGPQYSMTVLALRLSAYANGVSKLHGAVSRNMWQFLWPGTPEAEVPIGHVTNGVHGKTWLMPELRNLFDKHFDADWLVKMDDPATWAVDRIPDDELWHAHEQRKKQMVAFVRERVRKQLIRHGEGPQRVASADVLFDPDALTLGFARRFATYKRAMLIFRDMERIKHILRNPERPVQIVFSGKAHPADEPGKSLIQQIHQLSLQPEFFGKIVFLENYDMNVARHLISGADVWLNNPRRPQEASGTSGEKAALNGLPNFSVLDGWWEEGYDGSNGWAIGEGRHYKDETTQDDADALNLYEQLENEIIPLYYHRDEDGVPHGWVQRMKNAIHTCAPQYSMDRMVKEYVLNYYLPAARTGERAAAEHHALARELAAWKTNIRHRWGNIALDVWTDGADSLTVGEAVQVSARVWLNGIPAEQVAVEAVYLAISDDNDLGDLHVARLTPAGNAEGAITFTGAVEPDDSGRYALGVRVRPEHRGQINLCETGLVRWASVQEK
jgi:starch phosphorylase